MLLLRKGPIEKSIESLTNHIVRLKKIGLFESIASMPCSIMTRCQQHSYTRIDLHWWDLQLPVLGKPVYQSARCLRQSNHLFEGHVSQYRSRRPFLTTQEGVERRKYPDCNNVRLPRKENCFRSWKDFNIADLRLEISVGKTHFIHNIQSFQQMHRNHLRTRFRALIRIKNKFGEIIILKVLHCDKTESTFSNQPEKVAQSVSYNFAGLRSRTVKLHKHILILYILTYNLYVTGAISNLQQFGHSQQFLIIVNASVSVLLNTFYNSCAPELILL